MVQGLFVSSPLQQELAREEIVFGVVDFLIFNEGLRVPAAVGFHVSGDEQKDRFVMIGAGPGDIRQRENRIAERRFLHGEFSHNEQIVRFVGLLQLCQRRGLQTIDRR
jgi:hypothetical protein